MLEIRDVSVKFSSSDEVGAVEHVSMTVRDRTKTALIGETGSGKSVLLLSVLRLLPETAEITGSVILDGTDLLRLKDAELERIRGDRISYIPQGGGNSLNPLMNVGQQIGEPLTEHRNASKREAFLESIRLLKRFHVGSEEQWARAYPHMLSGGMKQRAMIAMGVAAGAKTILADEPTKGLDSDRIESVIECFNMLKDETVLCVTHDVNFARAIGDNISVMYAAQQLEYAERDDFFSCPLHPYSQAIIAAMPENGLQCTVGFAPPHTEYSRLICRFAERCPQCSDRCLNEMPPMINLDGHHVRCWQYAD